MRVLCVGHLTIDRYPTGPRLGGGALYGALSMLAAGADDVRLVSVAGDDALGCEELAALRRRLPMAVARDRVTTTFRNTYAPDSGARVQYVERTARPVTPEDVPEAWGGFDLVFLAPVIGEVDLRAWLDRWRGAAPISLGAQGWFKHAPQTASTGASRVLHGRWPVAPELLAGHVQVASMSAEDVVADPDAPHALAAAVELVALTHGANGAELHHDGRWHFVPALDDVQVVDPTGAGDAFAATLAHGMATGLTSDEAGRQAAAMAARVIGAEATSGLG